MAIVFISPQHRQRNFLGGFFLALLVVLCVIAIVMLLPEIQNKINIVPAQGVYHAPDVNINFQAIDSDQVKSLNSFSDVATDYSYVAKDAKGKQVSGTISAQSQDEATAKVIAMGLTIVSIQEVNIGRSNPFVTY